MVNVNERIYALIVFVSILSNTLAWINTNMDVKTPDLEYAIVSNDKEEGGLPRYIIRYAQMMTKSSVSESVSNVEMLKYERSQIIEKNKQAKNNLLLGFAHNLAKNNKTARYDSEVSLGYVAMRT